MWTEASATAGAKDQRSKLFSLIVDEATDVLRNEQMCIAIRWVDSSDTIHDDDTDLIQLSDTKSVTLFSTIKDMLMRCSLPLSNCIGQSYDGAAKVSGVRNGVQALLKKEADGNCLYVHCFAHSLNLCLKDVTQKCKLLRKCMDYICFQYTLVLTVMHAVLLNLQPWLQHVVGNCESSPEAQCGS